ncbi:MAG: thioredoxin domain-containing protein [Candidatus Woesearchaeota archaeon]
MFDKFLFFMTPMCPNCGEIHEWLKENPKLLAKGEEVDATTKEGLEKAKQYEVSGVPTIVFLKNGEKIASVTDIEEFQNFVKNKNLDEF